MADVSTKVVTDTSDIKTDSSQTYPHKKDDIEYEKEIKEAIKKLPLEQRIQFAAMYTQVLKRKIADNKDDAEIDIMSEKYGDLERPFTEAVSQLIKFEIEINSPFIELFFPFLKI